MGERRGKKMTKAEIIFEMGKKWIMGAAFRYIDRTAYIFITENYNCI